MVKKLMLLSLFVLPFVVETMSAGCPGGCCGGNCSRKARQHRVVKRAVRA